MRLTGTLPSCYALLAAALDFFCFKNSSRICGASPNALPCPACYCVRLSILHTIFSKASAEKSTREIPLVSSVMVKLPATGVCSSKGQPLNQSSREPPCPSTHRQAVPIDDPIQCLLPKRCCQKCGKNKLHRSSAALCVCESSSTRLLRVNTERKGKTIKTQEEQWQSHKSVSQPTQPAHCLVFTIS